VVATEAIPAGETVITVPDTLNLSLESDRTPTAAIEQILAPVVAQVGQASGLQEELAVYLLLLAHCPAALPEGGVDMQPYVEALPARVTVPDLFNDEEIDSLEYPVTGWMKARRGHLREVHSLLAAGAAAQELLGEEGCSWDRFMWAVTVVNSRTHAVRMGEGRVLRTVVPIVDMCNHEEEANLSLGYDLEAGVFRVRTTEDVAAGSPMSINYGARSGETWLQQYGFIPRHNPTDTILLDFRKEMGKLRANAIEAEASRDEADSLRLALLYRSGLARQPKGEVERASHRSMMEPEERTHPNNIHRSHGARSPEPRPPPWSLSCPSPGDPSFRILWRPTTH